MTPKSDKGKVEIIVNQYDLELIIEALSSYRLDILSRPFTNRQVDEKLARTSEFRDDLRKLLNASFY